MKRYQIHALSEWAKLELFEQLTFEAQRPRRVRLEFNTSHRVMVYGSHNEDMSDEKLMVSEVGHFTLMTAIDRTLYLRVVSEESSASVLYKNRAVSHVVTKMSNKKFTGLEMRRKRNPELELMMAMVRQVQQDSQDTIQRELAKLQRKGQDDERLAEVVEENPKLEKTAKGKAVPKDDDQGNDGSGGKPASDDPPTDPAVNAPKGDEKPPE